MGAVIGLALGYYLGVKAGPDAFEDLLEAWKTITGSQEAKDLLSGGTSMVRGFLEQGGSAIVGRLQGGETTLSRVA